MNSLLDDYQWPYHEKIVNAEIEHNLYFRMDLTEEIEKFFAQKYGCEAVLFPSARAGMAQILSFLNVNRKDIVFASQWSSKCVFDIIAKFSNPSVLLSPEVNSIIAVHKWGKHYKIPSEFLTKRMVIEDSVDSFILDQSELFSHGGLFEVLSLPKLLGALSGGIVLTRDKEFYQFAKKFQGQNMELANWQIQLKAGLNKPFDFLSFHDTELQNFSLTEFELTSLLSHLQNYELSQKIILERLNALESKVLKEDFIHQKNKRIGPVLPLDCSRYSLGHLSKVMTRNFSHENNLAKLKFKPCLLIPLHFGVESRIFDQFLANLSMI